MQGPVVATRRNIDAEAELGQVCRRESVGKPR
jgi:hypothetical protein